MENFIYLVKKDVVCTSAGISVGWSVETIEKEELQKDEFEPYRKRMRISTGVSYDYCEGTEMALKMLLNIMK